VRANSFVRVERERSDRGGDAGPRLQRHCSFGQRGRDFARSRASHFPRPRKPSANFPVLVVVLVVRVSAATTTADNNDDDHDDGATNDDDHRGAAASAAATTDNDDHDDDHDDNDDHDDDHDHRAANDDHSRTGAHRLKPATDAAPSGHDRAVR
jgi:hypothetical protein